jgi:hypothetical protein
MRAPVNPDSSPLYNYTLMPTHMHSFFSLEELHTAEQVEPFSFTKGCKPLKMKANPFMSSQHGHGNMLFDLESDIDQTTPIDDPETEKRMIEIMRRLMKENDAPLEQFERIGLNQ